MKKRQRDSGLTIQFSFLLQVVHAILSFMNLLFVYWLDWYSPLKKHWRNSVRYGLPLSLLGWIQTPQQHYFIVTLCILGQITLSVLVYLTITYQYLAVCRIGLLLYLCHIYFGYLPRVCLLTGSYIITIVILFYLGLSVGLCLLLTTIWAHLSLCPRDIVIV